MEKINIFDLKFEQSFRAEFYTLCEKIFDEAYLTNHTMVREFENSFGAWTGCKHNLAVNSGTSALAAALLCLKLEKDSEVIIPTNTFIACWYATTAAGLKPILTDIDKNFTGVDIESLQNKITKKTKAVIVTHVGGIICPQIEAIKKICAENNLYLIEDCAHAHGSSHKNIKAGAWGDIGCYSFHLTKTVTGGEGGLICTSNDELAARLTSIRQFGMSGTNPHLFVQPGHNLKMSELIAAFLLVELKRASGRIKRRNEIASRYRQILTETNWNVLKPTNGDLCGYYKSICIGPQNRSLIEPYFKQRNITLPNGVYFNPLHRQPVVMNNDRNTETFINSDHFSDYHFCLPCYPELSDQQVEFAAETLIKLK